MTGLVGRTGWSVRTVRTGIEAAVLVVGWLLGGTVGIGTLAYAVTIGPAVHILLPRLMSREVTIPEATSCASDAASTSDEA